MAETAQENEIKLTPKQKLFADYYVSVANLNATKAAIRAGYSIRSAQQIGFENLSKPVISSYILQKLQEMTMPADEILLALTNEAKGSIADVLDDDGTFNYEKMVERGSDKLLRKLKIKKTTRRTKDDEEIEEITHEFEMYDAQAAKVHLGKAHGIFIDRSESEVTIRETELITPKEDDDDS